MNIAILGVGGVGGYLAAQLSKDKSVNLCLLARGEHLKKIRENGLIYESKKETLNIIPKIVTDKSEDFLELDIVFMCTKSYDIESSIKNIENKLTENTRIIPLLNGIDIYERIRLITKKGIILPGCFFIFSYIKEPGIIKHEGSYAKLIFGKEKMEKNINNDDLLSVLDKCKINYEYLEKDIEISIWKKFLLISTFAMMTASENKSFGQLLENPELYAKIIKILEELVSLAKGKGISLPETVIEDTVKIARESHYDSYTSFWRDYQTPSKLNEKETLINAIIVLGKKIGIPTPTVEEIYSKLK